VEDDRGRKLNANTGPGASDVRPRLAASELARVWAAYVPGLSAIPPREQRGTMFRLFWIRPDETGFRDFAIGAGKHLIVGRHSLCDVVVPSDPDLSLRHLLVVPEGTPTEPAIRLVDLRAALPMYTTTDRPERSLTFQGPFAIRLGTYVLGGFRVGPGAPPVPPELPPMQQLEATSGADAAPRAPDPKLSTMVGHGPYRHQTLVTIMPRPSTLVEIADAPGKGPRLVELVGRREGTTARVGLREEDLRAGVLVGRADKCLDQGLKQVMSLHISRLHAVLLMDDRKTIWLYDAASTNGTYVSSTRVRSATLAELAPFVSRSPAVLGDGIKIELAGLPG
jgi:hypothetical protein